MNVDIKLLKRKEREVYSHLKDFQCATVERVEQLFSAGKTRVLVADEVGLGKTMIARGTIIKQAIKSFSAGKEIFKVVYICSNQNIANQNISKLDFFNATDDYSGEARLSMQHLYIRESEERNKSKYIQLVPLTPDTSFRIGGSRATKGRTMERALIYVMLYRTGMFNEFLLELKDLLIGGASKKSFRTERKNQKRRVKECEENTNGEYPNDFLNHLLDYNKKSHELDKLKEYLYKKHNKSNTEIIATRMIGLLRVLFAKASISRFNPDLVILDEFQRFKFMLDSDECDPETKGLIDLFFDSKGLKILMLSATPYKLYSTLDELDEAGDYSDHYSEFNTVIKFLLDNDDRKFNSFKRIWQSYSSELREYANGLSATIEIKPKAQKALYSVISRTERISVMDTGDYIDDTNTKTSLLIDEADIISYLELEALINQINIVETKSVEYVKSCPYLMSFMNNYFVKQEVVKYINEHPEKINDLDKPYLWLNYDDINSYKNIRKTNARLKSLLDMVINNGSEKYLWVPPSRPYYSLRGAYAQSDLFSKFMVFSSWEMVPRMISTMISYEVEQRTVCKAASLNNVEISYTDRTRYLSNRLQLEDSRMPPIALIYPSKTLANTYYPIRCINRNESLDDIITRTQKKISSLLVKLKKYESADSTKNSSMWYYLAPVLLDYEDDPHSFERANGGYEYWTAFNKLYSYIDNPKDLKLAKMPEDLSLILTYEAIGSFGNCAYRMNGNNKFEAIRLASRLLRYFNTPESAASVVLSYQDDGDNHWKNVLKYCVDGCLQAVLDEYYHIAIDGIQDDNELEKKRKANEKIIGAFEYRTGTFRINVNPIRKNTEKQDDIGMRTHYAAGFRKTAGVTNSEKDVIHIDSIRNAFNSPFKPFVLATTSIGQEGLDFHQYCRKIVHWNMPSNPIDLEQREGRINRYKCHAIRQDLAKKFAGLQIRNNVWNELFEKAVDEYRKPGQSELVPFWCLGSEQRIKIERIIPMYPISKDKSKYERLIKILSLYRLTLGQSRQEELVEFFLKEGKDKSELKGLAIDLSPYSRVSDRWKTKFARGHINSRIKETSDAIRELERFEFLKKEIKELEEKQLELEIQLEDMPTLKRGIKVLDKVENIGELIEYDEEIGRMLIDFGNENTREFDAPVAVGMAIKFVNMADRIIYEDRSQLRLQIQKIEKEIEMKRKDLKQLE